MKKSPGKDFWLFFPGEYSLIYVLFFQNLKCTLDLLHAFLITKGTVIQAQIVFRHVCPVNTHETFAEIFFAFVILLHKFLNILCNGPLPGTAPILIMPNVKNGKKAASIARSSAVILPA